ncbi:Heme oxygenase 2 [Balamuthia mandrillaris]
MAEALKALIKEQCPAFKNGCPYADASPSFKEQVAKCPVFQNDCPFANPEVLSGGGSAEELLRQLQVALQHHRQLEASGQQSETQEQASSSLEQQLLNLLPKLQPKGGEDKNAEKNEVEEEKKKRTNSFIEGLREKCPVFKEGCPFKELPQSFKEEVHKCPSFTQGCPFATICSNGERLIDALKHRTWEYYLTQGFAVADASSSPQMTSSSSSSVEPNDGATDENEERLAAQLKSGTQKSHDLAEKASFVKRFREGSLDKEKYREFVQCLYFVYEAMEAALAKHSDPQQSDLYNAAVARIHFPKELSRLEALEEDLEFYYGQNWRAIISPSPVTQEYAARLKHCSSEKPELLIAHSYTRYLGDLSGGQILKRFTKKSLNLQGNEGTAFYEFKNVPSANRFKNEYREKLNSLHLPQATADAIVDEANVAFELNMKLFMELENELDVFYDYIKQREQNEKNDDKQVESTSTLRRRKEQEKEKKNEHPATTTTHGQHGGGGGVCPFHKMMEAGKKKEGEESLTSSTKTEKQHASSSSSSSSSSSKYCSTVVLVSVISTVLVAQMIAAICYL